MDDASAVVVPTGTPVPPAEDRIDELPSMWNVRDGGGESTVFETDATEAYVRCACRGLGLQVVTMTKVQPGLLRVKTVKQGDAE